MGNKVTIDPTGIPDSSSFTTKLNGNLTKLADEFDKVLYRDGSQSLSGDLNANSQRIYNLPPPVDSTEPLRLADIDTLSGDVIINDNSVHVTQLPTEGIHFSNGVRRPAMTFFEAEAMANDLSEMKGYALEAGTTGGNGKPVFWVTNESSEANVVGSLPWAVAQATGAGGRVIVSPYGSYRIRLKSTLFVPADTTIDAPGRNCTILADGTTTVFDCRKPNWIIRRLVMDVMWGSPTAEKDWIQIAPRTSGGDESDKWWVAENEFRGNTDGAVDCTSSLQPTGLCRGTVYRNKFINCDKTMSFAITACSVASPPGWCDLAIDEPTQLFVTVHENHFDGCDQRTPRVGALTYVDVFNNVMDMLPHKRNDGTFGGASGAYIVNGGKAFFRENVFRAVVGSGYSGARAETVALAPPGGGVGATGGQGGLKTSGNVLLNSITLSPANEAKVPNPIYTTPLTPVAVPTSGAPLDTFIRGIEKNAGARVDTAPEGVFFQLDALGDFYPDQQRVVKRGNSFYVRVDEEGNAGDVYDFSQKALNFVRGSTTGIVGDAIAAPTGANYIAVTPESGDTDDLLNISGGEDGQILVLRAGGSSQTITIKTTGNIRLSQGSGAQARINSLRHIVLVKDATLWKEIARSIDAHLPFNTWTADTGTAKRTANATYSGTAEATYNQATVQALMNAVRDLSQTVKAMKDDLIA